jgi:protein-disulfide isomerase
MKLLTLIFPLIFSTSLFAADCQPLSETTAARLAQYVHDKFGFAPSTAVRVGTTEFVGSSCYRKVTFLHSEGGQAVFYLSPDQLYLSHTLMDTTTDPNEDRRQLQLQQLQQQTPLNVADFVNGDFPSTGPQEAAITIIEFADFQCPFCRQQAEILRQRILPANRNVRLVFRNLPIPGHPWARAAAEMGACVYRQSNQAFWDVYDALYKKQPTITPKKVGDTIKDVVRKHRAFNMASYHECVTKHETSDLVQKDIAFAQEHKIQGTPTLFINGYRNEGVMRLEDTTAIIRKLSQ